MDYKNAFDFSGKTALVVGGAGGLGGEIVNALSDCGCSIAIVDIRIEPEPQIVEETRRKGVKCNIYKTNIAKEDEVCATVKQIIADLGRIDILVNSAGAHVHKSFIDFTVEDWDSVIDGNLKGVFLMSREVGRYMIAQGGGRIISLSSVKSVIGMEDKYVVYCIAKGGINMFTKGLASEWAKYNITVNAIAPTFIITRMSELELEAEGPEFRRKLIERIPLGRFGEKKDVALTALYLASDSSDFVTGQIVFVDGGVTSIQ